jgi:hypothetical protein
MYEISGFALCPRNLSHPSLISYLFLPKVVGSSKLRTSKEYLSTIAEKDRALTKLQQ